MVSNKNDTRYLLILDSYGSLPDVTAKQSAVLSQVYYDLLMQFENISLPLLEAKRNVIVKLIDLVIEIVKTSGDADRIELASTILRALMITDDPNPDWLYKVDFTNQASQKRMLSVVAMEINKYNQHREMVKGEGNRDNILDSAAQLELILGISIDPYTCSVSKYLAYQRAGAKKIKMMEKWRDR
jgi:hypothetical protein